MHTLAVCSSIFLPADILYTCTARLRPIKHGRSSCTVRKLNDGRADMMLDRAAAAEMLYVFLEEHE